jgi:P27 family predicted phage terminase small subunit
MSNPPVPFVLKKLRGNPGCRRMRPEPEPKLDPQVPEAPAWLSAYAREEWARLAGEMHRIGLLTTVDHTCFAVYCQSYAWWREAEEAIAALGDNKWNETGRRLMRISRYSAAGMLQAAGYFGLTPVARSRIAAGIGPVPDSKFGDLLA